MVKHGKATRPQKQQKPQKAQKPQTPGWKTKKNKNIALQMQMGNHGSHPWTTQAGRRTCKTCSHSVRLCQILNNFTSESVGCFFSKNNTLTNCYKHALISKTVQISDIERTHFSAPFSFACHEIIWQSHEESLLLREHHHILTIWHWQNPITGSINYDSMAWFKGKYLGNHGFTKWCGFPCRIFPFFPSLGMIEIGPLESQQDPWMHE